MKYLKRRKTYKRYKSDFKRENSPLAHELKENLQLYSSLRNSFDESFHKLKSIYSDFMKGDLTKSKANKLEKSILKSSRNENKNKLREALEYTLFFVFAAVGLYVAVYLRDSITGFSVFTNNNPGFDFASLLFIGVFVFFVYMFMHRKD